MASIQKEIPIAAPAAAVWDAVRDFGAVHIRLAPGFVTDTRLDGDVRIVSFANGSVVREQLVDCNDERRRLVYAIKNQRITQHSASFQIFPEGEERCRMIWTTDVLPHEIAPYIEQQMELGARAMQDTLGRQRV
ncbi:MULTISPECIES: SRPBCC family protein [unclassified Bradyrhizobium]|uniref:SRPBCC family protein n=1 Tax=unclassified Bradyrhizobium TaxID=2631580 RepID=UPI0028ED815C|nr:MULTISPECIES: SRPBCC family protein [unclassified Bradyrhizobium]